MAFLYVGCDDDIVNREINNLELLQQAATEDVLEKFEDEKIVTLSKIDIEKESCKYLSETFEINYWIYDTYHENGTFKNRVYNFYGLNENNLHSEIKSSLVLSFELNKSILEKSASAFECGKANMIYEDQNNFKSEQYIINVVSSKAENFDLENTQTKFYISNGTGGLKDKKGFAYMKLEIENEATFGCYPNSSNYPDDFEDGTCAMFNDCGTNCETGNGKAKLYLLGFSCDE